MPDELFRASHFHNSPPKIRISWCMRPTFILILGAGQKVIKPLMCKHNVVYDLFDPGIIKTEFLLYEEEGECYAGRYTGNRR